LDVIISIVSLGRFKERFPHSILYPSMADLRAWYQSADSSLHQDLEVQTQGDQHILGLTFITTQEGYIGATLAGAQSGKSENQYMKW
jgi:hypothetical protein